MFKYCIVAYCYEEVMIVDRMAYDHELSCEEREAIMAPYWEKMDHFPQDPIDYELVLVVA